MQDFALGSVRRMSIAAESPGERERERERERGLSIEGLGFWQCGWKNLVRLLGYMTPSAPCPHI